MAWIFSGTVVDYLGITVSGAGVRAYQRDSGELIDSTTTTDSGTFSLTVSSGVPHYAVAIHPTVSSGNVNADVYDYIIPNEV